MAILSATGSAGSSDDDGCGIGAGGDAGSVEEIGEP